MNVSGDSITENKRTTPATFPNVCFPILKGRLKAAWEIRGVKDVRVLGAIGVIELEKGVDMARFQVDCVAQGVWVRPFGRLVYLMPPYIISDDLLTELADKTVQILKEHSK